MDYKGVIIEESLDDKSVLKSLKILDTKVEQVTDKHKTPWVKQWHLHTVEIPEENSGEIAEQLSNDLDKKHDHSWYADYKNDKHHYIIYKDKIFKVDLQKSSQYKEAKQYGISIGIPEYQVDFAPDDEVWKR
jgi:hypothetical protein